MPFKPMKLKAYTRWIGTHGWYLEKGGIDWKLRNAEGQYITQIKVIHPGNEVHPDSVKKTKQEIKNAGLK